MKQAKLQLITSMVIFGTIGIFVRGISLPSSVIACVRGVVGMLFLLAVMALRRTTPDRQAIRAHWKALLLSGAALGANWILLFEAYRYTTVATATLCYYLAPMFVLLVSPLVVREHLTLRRLLCVAVSLLGMVFVSGVLDTGIPAADELTGILLGVGAAVLYATVVLLNKRLKDVPSNDRTVTQLGLSALVVLPYILLTEDVTQLSVTPTAVGLLLFVGIVHTGIAYALYFGSLKVLSAQTAAIFGYIDPIVAIILSALLLKEQMGLTGVIGAVLILGSALVSELPEKINQKNAAEF